MLNLIENLFILLPRFGRLTTGGKQVAKLHPEHPVIGAGEYRFLIAWNRLFEAVALHSGTEGGELFFPALAMFDVIELQCKRGTLQELIGNDAGYLEFSP